MSKQKPKPCSTARPVNWRLVHEAHIRLVNEERAIEARLVADVVEGLWWAYEGNDVCRSCTQRARHAKWCLVGKAQKAADELKRTAVTDSAGRP